MKLSFVLLPFAAALTLTTRAQVFDPSDSGGHAASAPNNSPTIINNGGNQQKPKQSLGNDVPFMAPGSETAQWDAHLWNVTNNRLFRARFEKYLASPEAGSAQDQAY